MSKRAKDGACLETLVRMAIPLCKQAQRLCPRTGPGREPQYDDWKMAVLIMIPILKKRKSKSAQYRWIIEHQAQLLLWLGLSRMPARSTFFDRYKRLYGIYQKAVQLQGEKAVSEQVADATVIAVDKSLIASRGPHWHQKHRKRGKVPKRLRGVDRDSTWCYSEYHGWVQGYGYEVAVTATQDSVVFPLLASVDTANVSEQASFRAKIPSLPRQTRFVLVDRGYDADDHGEHIEFDPHGHRTGRRFLCPPQRRSHGKRTPVVDAPGRSAKRRHRMRHRQSRIAFYRSPKGKRLYRRRGQCIEPFNDWFKSTFELSDRVWHRGLENNRTQIMCAMFCYQLLMRYNHRIHLPMGRVQWILDSL